MDIFLRYKFIGGGGDSEKEKQIVPANIFLILLESVVFLLQQ